jgi:hypothetical protein
MLFIILLVADFINLSLKNSKIVYYLLVQYNQMHTIIFC